MKTVFPLFYAAPSVYYAYWLHTPAEDRFLETKAYYQKQSYRNRATIAGPNGKHNLTIPVQRSRKLGQLDTAIQVEEGLYWKQTHFKTYETFYRSSPFFEFYEEEFKALLMADYPSLFEFNLALHHWILEQLQLDSQYTPTTEYITLYERDLRDSIHPKKPTLEYPTYYQVFNDKQGFIYPTSILDLLFCEGTNAPTILTQLSQTF